MRPLKCCAIGRKSVLQRNHTILAAPPVPAIPPIQPATLPPPAAKHFVQTTFLIGVPMRKILSVFVVAVGEFFSFRPDWHQDDRARPLVRQYQTHAGCHLARSSRSGKLCGPLPPLWDSLPDASAECESAGSPLPFGCREHHRRQQANERSKKHYRTDQGRRNKKRLNGKRSAAAGDAENGGRQMPCRRTRRPRTRTPHLPIRHRRWSQQRNRVAASHASTNAGCSRGSTRRGREVGAGWLHA